MKKNVMITLCLGMLTACCIAQKENMIKTASGLKIKVLKEAENKEAASPKKGQKVKVNYTGWIADEHGNPILNQKFDSSLSPGRDPFEFEVGGPVIQGWNETVPTMKVGQKVRVVIPPKLAYGERGFPGTVIVPNSTLVFDIELLDIVK